jgi:hypothetical protein
MSPVPGSRETPGRRSRAEGGEPILPDYFQRPTAQLEAKGSPMREERAASGILSPVP